MTAVMEQRGVARRDVTEQDLLELPHVRHARGAVELDGAALGGLRNHVPRPAIDEREREREVVIALERDTGALLIEREVGDDALAGVPAVVLEDEVLLILSLE